MRSLAVSSVALLTLFTACSSGDGGASSIAMDISPRLQPLTEAEFPGVEWYPTSCDNKCDTDRGGASIEYIVIHDTEESYDSAVQTLQNDSGKSAHYIVGKDGRIGQFVTEATLAWHSCNSYYNARSIGIEHEGHATEPFTEAQYAASAKLVDHLATKYNIPRDRAHIIGHDQVPNGAYLPKSAEACADSPKACEANESYGGCDHHTDPGIWEWPTYMARLGGTAKCNDVTNLWNCSYEKTQAFRCANDKVEVATCDGAGACVVEPNGQDDVCNIAPKAEPAAPPPAVEAPKEPAPPAPSASTGNRLGNQNDSSSSCAIGRPARGQSGWLFAALAGLALVAAARGRRRYASPFKNTGLRISGESERTSCRGR